MKIVVPGGSGHVGAVLARAFERDGHEVIVLSRTAGASSWPTGWINSEWEDSSWGSGLPSRDRSWSSWFSSSFMWG